MSLNYLHLITLSRMNLKNLKTLIIIIVCIFFNISSVNCDSEMEEKIVFRNQVYGVLSQIPSEYDIVRDNNLGAKLGSNSPVSNSQKEKSQKFVQRQAPDYYVAKSLDEFYQGQKYDYIQGKDIFTLQYIYSQLSDSNPNADNHPESVITWRDDLKEQINKKTEAGKLTSGQQQNLVHTPTADEVNQQIIIEQKSTEIYNQFKNLEILKQKNLRQIITDGLSNEKNQNLLKLVGFITIGLILSFAIIKKATKTEPALHQKNQEKTQLRLRDTVEDDDEQLSSSQSDD